jgi:hypothetical protein
VSSALKEYLAWPYVAQVFKLEQRFVRVVDGKEEYQVSYGVTSLTRVEASPADLLALQRGQWGLVCRVPTPQGTRPGARQVRV